MAKFRELTVGAPLDGQGECVYIAGTEVSNIKRVYKQGDAWIADLVAPGYRVGGSHGLVDKIEEPVASTVPLVNIIA